MLPAQNGHSNMTRTCKEMQDPGQTDPHSQSVESWLSVSVTLDEGFLEDWGGPPFFSVGALSFGISACEMPCDTLCAFNKQNMTMEFSCVLFVELCLQNPPICNGKHLR